MKIFNFKVFSFLAIALFVVVGVTWVSVNLAKADTVECDPQAAMNYAVEECVSGPFSSLSGLINPATYVSTQCMPRPVTADCQTFDSMRGNLVSMVNSINVSVAPLMSDQDVSSIKACVVNIINSVTPTCADGGECCITTTGTSPDAAIQDAVFESQNTGGSGTGATGPLTEEEAKKKAAAANACSPTCATGPFITNPACACCGDCSVCDFVNVFLNAARFGLGLLGVISLVMFIWGGLMWIMSGGNTERVSKGKSVLTGTVIGIIIVLLAWVVINAIVVQLTGKKTPEGVGLIFSNPWNICQ